MKQHRIFQRQYDDLLCEMDISFVQAALGDEIDVPTLEGKAKLKIPEGTQTETVFRMRGKGMPKLRGYGRGDMHVRVSVVTPTRLTEQQKELLLKFSESLGETAPAAGKDGNKEKGFFGKVKDAITG